MDSGSISDTQRTMVLPLLQETNIRGKPYITVSAKGIVNGTSRYPNDGADFGPDTTLGATALGQYGSPYTLTTGIQEAVTYSITTAFHSPAAFGAYYVPMDVVIAPGTYNVNENIVLPSADQPYQFVLKSADGFFGQQGILFGPNVTRGFDFSNMKSGNVLIQGFAFQQSDYTSTTFSGTYLYLNPSTPANSLQIHNCGFYAYSTNPLISISNYSTVLLTDISLEPATGSTIGTALSFGDNITSIYITTKVTINPANPTSLVTFTNSGTIESFHWINYGDDGVGFGILGSSINRIIIDNRIQNTSGIVVVFNTSDVFTCNMFKLTGGYGNFIFDFNNVPTGSYIDTLVLEDVSLSIGSDFTNLLSNTAIVNNIVLHNISNRTSYTFTQSQPAGSKFGLSGNIYPSSLTDAPTSGSFTAYYLDSSQYHKKIMLIFNAYENDTATDQTANIITNANNMVVVSNNTGLTVSPGFSGSTMYITVTSPDSTTTYSGIVIIEGY